MPFVDLDFLALQHFLTAPDVRFFGRFFQCLKFVSRIPPPLQIEQGSWNLVCIFSKVPKCAFWRFQHFSLIEPVLSSILIKKNHREGMLFFSYRDVLYLTKIRLKKHPKAMVFSSNFIYKMRVPNLDKSILPCARISHKISKLHNTHIPLHPYCRSSLVTRC